jgi:hypothetical protein
MKKNKPVALYARMWPRELFDGKNGNQVLVKGLKILSMPGVYVLYHDRIPYYVGKAAVLRKRLWPHANRPGSKYYNFWNFFSVFVVEDPTLRGQLEGFLIAAMPTANGARPRIQRAQLPLDVRKFLHVRSHAPWQLNQIKSPKAPPGV